VRKEENHRVNEMKYQVCLIILLLVSTIGTVVSAQDTAFSQVVVSRVTIDPSVMMDGDTGSITVNVMNTGTQAVDINRATLYPDGVVLLNEGAYETLVTLGPGNSRDFTFQVRAKGTGGLYQPRFYLDFRGSGSMSYYIPLKIDTAGLQASVIDAPDFFSTGRKDQITLRIGNPRDNNLTGIIVTPHGQGVKTVQSNYFVGDLGAGKSTQVVFDVTPSQATTLTFHTSYRNGINAHSTDTEVPIQIDDSRRSADLVINNVKLTSSGGSYELDGDITNGGLDDAKSIMVTVKDPARPVDPYPSYVVGGLAVDDFSSFSVTFTAPALTSVPVLVQWKDSDGNSYQNTIDVNLRTAGTGTSTGSTSTQQSGASRGGGGPFGFFGGSRAGAGLPYTEIIIVIIVAVVGVVAWRKGVFSKILGRGKGKQGNQQAKR
jgi:hypothetical protein